MSDNPLLNAYQAQRRTAPASTGNPLLDTFTNEKTGQQGFDFGAFKSAPARPASIPDADQGSAQRGIKEMQRAQKSGGRSMVENTGQTLTDRADTWAETGRKALAHVKPLMQQVLGGMLTGTVETAPDQFEGLAETPGPIGTVAAILRDTGSLDNARAVLAGIRASGKIPGQALYAQAQQDIEANGYAPGDSNAKRWVGQLSDSLVLMVPAVAASILTKNPEVAGAVMGVGVGGQQYEESRTSGRTVRQAAVDGIWNGVTEALGERVPLEVIMKPGGKFFARALKAAGAEGIQEVVTQILQTGYDKGVLHPEMTWGEAVQQVGDAGIVGALMGGGIATATAPFYRGEGSPTAVPPVADVPVIDQAPAAPTTPAEQAEASLQPVATVRPQGVVETAAIGAATLTQADLDSAIPDAVIAQGKAELAKATAAPTANDILRAAGVPEIGGRVSITWNGTTMGGRVVDALDTDAGAAGRAQGVRIQRDDGTMLEEHFDTLRDLGVQLSPEVAAPPSAAAPSADPLPATGGNLGGGVEVTAPTSSPAPKAKGGIDGFMARVARAESPSDTAKNPRSSAEGRYQFTDGTFESYYRKIYGDTGESRADILKKKTDGAVQDKLMRQLTKDNGDALRRAGVEVTAGNRYLAHFAGPGGAVALNKADPSTPVEKVLGAAVVKANPFLNGKTAGEVVAWAARKVGNPTEANGQPSSIDVNDEATPVQFQDMDWGDSAPPAPEAETSAADSADSAESTTEPVTPAPRGKINDKDGWPTPEPIRNLMRDDGRFAVRGGAVLTTPSGRETSPAPKFNDSTPATRKLSLAAQEKWLRDEAIAEAGAAPPGSDAAYALPTLRGMTPGNMSRADHGYVNDVLFGDYQGPKDAASWKTDRPPQKPAKPVQDRSVAIVMNPAAGTTRTFPVGTQARDAAAPTVTDMPSGKSVIVKGATPAQLAAIKAALPEKVQPIENKREAGVVFSAKYRDRINEALASAAAPVQEAGGEPAATAQRDARGNRTGSDAIPSETARVDPVRSETQRSDRGAAGVGGTARDRDDSPEKSGRTAEGRTDPVASQEAVQARPSDQTSIVSPARQTTSGQDGIGEGGRTSRPEQAGNVEPAAASAPQRYGTTNKLFTADAAERARAKLRSMASQLNSGFDPEVAAAGLTLLGYHIEAGARSFIAASRAVAADLGMAPADLKGSLRSWYSAARNYFEDNGESTAGMDDDATARALLASINDWGNAVPSAPQETTNGVQAAVPDGDAGPGARDLPGTGEDRGAGRAGAEEVGGGARVVRRADEGRAKDTERGGDRPGGAPDRRAERARPDAGVPATRAGITGSGVAAPNFTIAPGALDEQRGPKAKAQDNLTAINVLKRLAREDRPATAEEQATLARYVGWGGLKNVFPDGDGAFGKGFEDVGRMLRSVLTDAEYDTARRSIQYAHFTSETIVREMWRLAEALGFGGGTVFEPGMGTGNFAGMMPPALAARTRYAGIEMDGITAGIAKALYPQSGIAQADYTRYEVPQGAFDLVIGNPPFSETVVKADPAYKRNGFVLHDYFFAKSLDAVKPGGLLMFVTSAGTMNKLDPKAREYLAARADLVGAIRLPGDAFEQNAGTNVTTDIVVLRRRAAGEKAGDQAWTGTTPVTLPTREAGVTKEGNVSRYFTDHPEQVLGEQGFFDTLVAGIRYAVRRDRGDNTPFPQQLAAAVDRLAGAARTVTDTTPPPRAPADLDFDSTEKKNGSFYLSDNGTLMQQQGTVGAAVGTRAKGAKGGISQADQDKIKKLVPIRDALRDIYRHDLAERPAEADAARADLNKRYDAFVAEHGPINKGVFTRRRPSRVQVESARRKAREEARARGFEWEDGTFDAETLFDSGYTLAQVAAAREEARADAQRAGKAWDEGTFDPEDVPDTVLEKRPNIDAFMDDPESYRLRSIEHYNDSTGEAAKGPVFFQNVVSKQGVPEIRNAVDALYHTLNLVGRVDLDAIARAIDASPADVIDQLAGQIYRTPAGEWEQAATYLSGNVRTKLAEAEAAAANDPSLRGNVEALRAVIPPDLGKSDVRATLGMNWIDARYIEQFGESLGMSKMTVTYQPVTAAWHVMGDRASAAATSTWGTDRRSASELIDDALNGKSPKIYDTYRDADGNTKSVLNSEATQAASDKLVAIKERFGQWIYEDADRASKLLRIYNDTFNSLVAPQYDGSYMTTPGVSALWSWRPHQLRVMARIIQTGNAYIAHAVGAGKTSEAIGAAMEMKRLGLVNKPAFTVPNHMLMQFTKEFYEQYPTARIMVADDDRNFITDRRKQFISDMALADIDAVIIKHSAFDLIPMSNEFQERHLAAELNSLRETLEAVDKGERQTRRKIEQMIEQTEQRIRAVTSGKKDQTFTFEETGIDFLFVDEAHLFRKLDFATSRGDVKGIDPTGSMRSMNLFMKTRYLEERRPGRSHVLMSGTPVTNTMAELFTISRYLQPDTLRERGIDKFDAWASAFGDTVTDLEPTAGGTYKPVTRFSQFVNVPELSAMVRQVMDVVTPEQLEQYVTRPEVRNHMVVVPESPGQALYRADLQARMEAIEKRSGPPKKGDDIMLSVINDGRNAAIDMRLVDPAADEERTKLMEAIENVARIWRETKRHPFYEITAAGYSEKPAFHAPAAQMVFASRGVGAGRAFNVHRFMVEELAKRGVPREEMVIFNALKNDVAKQRVFNDMKVGKVRILLGSVDKMGTGVNAQRLLAANHNMDPEWLPSSDEQRNGRIIRQGNLNRSVDIYNYSTKGTYDSAMWGMMGRKAKFIEGFFRGDPTLRDMEDLGEASKYEQAKALTTRDPRILVLTEAKQELEKEVRRRGAHESDIANAEREHRSSLRYLRRLEDSLSNERADLAQRQDIAGDAFTATLHDGEGGNVETFTERAAFQEALKLRLADTGTKEDIVPIGTLGGFTLARQDYKNVRFTEGKGKVVEWGSTPVLLLNGDELGEEGARRYKELAKTNTAVSAQTFLSKLDRIVSETEESITRYRQRAEEFAARAADAGPYKGEARIAELEAQVREIEGQLVAEQKAAEAAKQREDAPNTPPEENGPKYSLMGSGPERIITDAERSRFSNARDVSVAKFILPDGRTMASGDETHEYVADELGFGGGEAGVDAMLQATHAIRVGAGGGSDIQIVAPPTERQRATLARYVNATAKFVPANVDLAYADSFTPVSNGADLARLLDVRYSVGRDTAYEDANRAAETANLADRLRALGISDRITLEVVDRIAENPAAIGSYWKRVVTVATENANADMGQAFALDHEAVHAMRELGLFRPAEWTALSKQAQADTALMADIRRRYGKMNLSEDEMIEEAVADMFARWRQGREAQGFARAAFQRILDLLSALRRLFGGGPSGGSTLRAIDTGEIGSRDEQTERILNGDARYAVPAAQPGPVEFADSATEERWKKAAEGLGSGDGLLLRVRTNLQNIGNGFARHWEHLPNVPRYAALQQKLRGLEAAPQAARERAVRMLSDMVKGFTREDLDLLARKVVLDDLIWEADQEHDLPFGFTPESLRAEKKRIDGIVNAQPGRKVWAAAMKRKIVNRAVADELVQAGVLEAERVKNPSYFRHQVLDYARTEARLARGTGSRLRTPKWAKRMGSTLDINANLLEAEFDWLNKALTDIPTAQTIDWIKKSEHNILDRLQKQAKDSNEQGIADLIAKEKSRDGDVTTREREFRQRFAYGFKVIRDELDAGNIANIPPSLKRAADAIQSGQKGGEPPFAFLSWLLDTDQPGSMGAAMILKAVGERRSFRAEKLGDRYVDPGDTEAIIKRFAPEGYRSWQPDEGKLLFTVKTLPEHAIDAMLKHIDSVPADGISQDVMRAQLEKTRNVMAVGGDKYKMVLPTEVADTLTQLRRPDVEGLLGELMAVPLRAWKRWVLINPRRIIKYNLNNLSGDLDAVLAGNPRLLRRTPAAARELAAVMRGKALPSSRYNEAVARGVFDSGLSIQEIPDINKLSAFEALTQPASNRPDKAVGAAIGKAWRGLQGFTQWRENVFRYAAYLDYADRIEAGEPLSSIGYGASVPAMVDAVADQKDQAALLARDLMGDYGAISANGAWLRSHLIPFWSWTELNTKRYWRLTLNAGSQGLGHGIATGGALALSRGAVVSVGLGLRMAAVYGLINLWNWLFFDDEEKELSEEQQRQLHIILGRNSNGDVVTLRTQGAFSDVLGMLGLQDVGVALKAHEQGRGSMGEIIAAPAKALVGREVTSLTPMATIPAEALYGKKLFPDPFNPRPIRDQWRNLAQAFSLENEYDAANDLPSRGYGRSFIDGVTYRRNPGEIAYDEARGLAYDWNKRVKGQEGGSDFSTPRSNAMRNYRTALRYGDQDAADEAMKEMGGFGVTEKDLSAMVKRAEPLGPISKRDRRAFLESLTDEELEKFGRAEEWYRLTFGAAQP